MKILNRAYLVLAVIFGVVGIVQGFQWYESYETIRITCVLKFVPAVVFLIAYAVSRKASRTVIHAFIIPLCTLAIGFWLLVSTGVDGLIAATAEVTVVRRYDEILSQRWNGERNLVQHFPQPIPSDARDVRFAFRPHFLQGGAYVQLRYSTTPDIIAELYERFSSIKTKSFIGGERHIHRNAKDGMPTTDFYTSGSKDHKFPDDYEIMIFDKVLKEKDRGPEFWNHGETHGVAISKERNEIVYWAESW
jgi:hypothetical protein